MFLSDLRETLIFIDIEAENKNNKILQFSAIKYCGGKVIDKINIFANPHAKISFHVSSMVKNNLDKIKKGETQKVAASKIFEFINNHQIISYGSFDYSFVKKFIKSHLSKELEIDFFDLQNWWKSKFKMHNVWSLSKLAHFMNIEVIDDKLHDALYDTEILLAIFKNLEIADESKIKDKIWRYKVSHFKESKSSQNKKNKDAILVNNKSKNTGMTIIKIKFSKKELKEENKSIRILEELNAIEIQNGKIKRNWSFLSNWEEHNLEENEEFFLDALRRVIIVTRNKLILIEEKEYPKLIELFNFCSKKINVFPLNKILFSDGYEELFNEIDFSMYRFEQNIDLIKKWLVHNHLKVFAKNNR